LRRSLPGVAGSFGLRFKKTGSFFSRFEVAALSRHGFVGLLPTEFSVQNQFVFAD
jgi:hypothetical protein